MSYRSFPFGFSRAPDRPRGLRTHVGALVVACAAGLIPLAASAADFTVTPTTLVFGSVPVGATATIVVTITNTTAVSQTPNFSGGAPLDPTNFGGSQNCAGVPLAPGGSCQFNYEFSPATLGAKSSSTSIGINSDNFPITMSGTGISAFSVAPTDLAFGGVPLGTTATIPVTITNTSGVSQTPNFSGGARSIRPTSAAPRIAQAFLW
ncbi:MAG TPA: choice-of-anchor D domain-containing protein, partial [Casimicrobiaceae bacterium]|nr:choice-of-anchor D domain-containing protein [Casimicrobiaceae bacterium]